MIEIDGSMYSGSGTLLRYAVALATLVGEPLHMTRIRAKREKPGLMPQHLQAVRACCSLSDGELEGAELKSAEIFYRPGKSLKGGNFQWDIGTAGSTTMLAFTLIPLALFAQRTCRFAIRGGLFQDNAPSAFHMQRVLIPILQRMGAKVRVEVLRPGYLPRGQGHLMLEVEPLGGFLKPLFMIEQGNIKEVWGISLASHLEKEKVSERMANRCRKLLEERGYPVRMEVLNDKTAMQKGAALLLRAETDTECLLGADQAGKPGRRSEAIAEFVVHSLLEDLRTKATTDRHLGDQLILFAALGHGRTEYLIPQVTEHVESNLWLVEKILGAKGKVEGSHLRIEGIGFHK
ncbi:MAG: RNA 3'-phosphate cyclase [Deltaproteobacteria bacterium]|nr:RNA 3'-phosphate cyclase [Deltaproteobacteria bacterium]